MTDDAVLVVLTVADAAIRDAGAVLFPGVPLHSFERDDLRPSAPFDGSLFALLAEQPRGGLVALVVPVLAAQTDGQGLAAGDLVPITDHVNLEGCGPLTGPWPVGMPREFPGMTGLYQPALIRPRAGAPVYSSGVVVAGVADARRLTSFEARAVREGGWRVVSDVLVPAAIVAAYYGLRVAACGLVQATLFDRE